MPQTCQVFTVAGPPHALLVMHVKLYVVFIPVRAPNLFEYVLLRSILRSSLFSAKPSVHTLSSP